MPKLQPGYLPETNLEWALYWASQFHIPVFPLGVRSKKPLIAKRDGGRGLLDATLDEAQIRRWWMQYPNANIGGRVDGRIVLDVDPRDGGSSLDLPRTGWIHRTGGSDNGEHHFYRLSQPQLLRLTEIKQKDLQAGVNVRLHDRGYVVLPPSVHPDTGRQYALVAVGDPAILPDELFDQLTGLAAVPQPDGSGRNGAKVHSLLTSLLADRPGRGEGRANNWLRDVCGFYAKQYHGQQDLYLAHVKPLAVWDPPLDDADKTINSIWDLEHKNHPERTEQTARKKAIEQAVDANGWLVSSGFQLVCPVWVGKGEDRMLVGESWADFDLQARGVVLDQEGKAAEWIVTLKRARDRAQLDASIGFDVLSDSRKLAAWCTLWRVSIAPPERGQEGRGTNGARLMRYLEAQNPLRVRRVECLGWDDQVGGFITHDGVLRADERLSLDQAAVHPVARLTKDAQFHYGFDHDRMEARRVLAEVLTYQDETVSSVFGAWWALCLIKGQLMRHLSQFPGMAIEAASESGKTSGFFDQMLQLSGSMNRPGMPTYAVIRDRVGAHRSGIVWMDDREDLEPYHEILRAAPMEAAISKKAENRTDTLDFVMVAPILITGEALGLDVQKALVDRFVQLKLAGSIKNRSSLKDPSRLQWLDVLDLRDRYPDGMGGLTVLAGWLVQEALKHADGVIKLIKSLKHGSGRWGDTMTLIRVGARLLDRMVYEVTGSADDHAKRVDEWVASQVDPGEENTLTTLILPACLRAYGNPSIPAFEPLGRGSVTTPAFVEKDGIVRYRTELLADWWHKHQHGRVKLRTETVQALASQADRLAVGSGGSSPKRVQGAPGRLLVRYRALSPAISAVVLQRAHGADLEGPERLHLGGVTSPVDTSTTVPAIPRLIEDDSW